MAETPDIAQVATRKGQAPDPQGTETHNDRYNDRIALVLVP